jgi:hypothetical protein
VGTPEVRSHELCALPLVPYRTGSVMSVVVPRRCLSCGTLGPFVTRCPDCDAQRLAYREANPRRRIRKSVLYGPEYRAAKRQWAPIVRAGGVLCARCRRPIDPAGPWDLGHQGTRGYHPEHPPCNRSNQ